MENDYKIKDIFITFLRIGTILLGGGYVIIPIVQSELIQKRHWITEEELVEYYALSQSLPGIIAINLSIFIGYKLRGKLGAISAIFGLIFTAFWIIVGLSTILATLTENTYIKGIFWGVEIAVLVLIISAIREMWDKAIKNHSQLVIYLIALCTMLLTKIYPEFIIIASIFFGIIYKSIIKKRGKE